jgi:nucleotide-binding universal stress UspA family protein
MNWLSKKTIIVPVDFSDDSFVALDTARELADEPSNLHVIHVLPILEPADPGVIWATIDDHSRSQNAGEALQKELAQRGFDPLQVVIRFGDPGHEIAKYSQKVDAGLVIISSHGRSALEHLLIGSVAERVVRLAHCPILVLKKSGN